MSESNSANRQPICLKISDQLPLQHLFNEVEMSDCCFVFIEEMDSCEQGEKKKKKIEQRIRAHKFVLAANSPVFKTMFYGPIPVKDEIVITDVSLEVFQSMLKLLYTGEESLGSGKELFELLLAVDKYDFGKLSNLIEKKLVESLSIENVMKVYEFFDLLQKPDMIDKIRSFVQDNTLLILKHESFTQIQRKTLNFVLSQQKLNVAEIQLFQASLNWAKAECERNFRLANPKQLREALGEELFLVRIPAMSAQHFQKGPVASGIFDIKEQNEFFNYIVAPIKSEATSEFVSRFNLDSRNGSQGFPLNFGDMFKYISTKFCMKDAVNTLQFKSSADFILTGFYFGCVEGNLLKSSVVLLENSIPLFFEENMPFTLYEEEESEDEEEEEEKSEKEEDDDEYMEDEETFDELEEVDDLDEQDDLEEIEEEDEKENAKVYLIKFPSPQLISTGSMYKLNLTLKLEETQKIWQEIERGKFTVRYEREFQDTPILIELENLTSSDLNIYAFELH